MAIYILSRPLRNDEELEHTLLSNSEQEVSVYVAPRKQFLEELCKWVHQTGKGRVFLQINGLLGIALDDASHIVDLKQQFSKWASTIPVAIGVAPKIFDAYRAMRYGEHHNLDTMVFYDDSIEDFYDDKFEEDLFKSETDSSTPNPYDIDFAGLELDKEDNEEDKKAASSSKKKILDVLMELKQKAPVLAKLKEIDPDALKSIHKLVEALGAIAQQGLFKAEYSDQDLAVGAEDEAEEHPWLSEEDSERVAKDHLRENPKYYKAENSLTEKTVEESSSSETDEFIETSDSNSDSESSSSEESLEKVSGSIGDAGDLSVTSKQRAIRVQGKDPVTGQPTGTHYHEVGAGMVRGAQGHARSSYKRGKEDL